MDVAKNNNIDLNKDRKHFEFRRAEAVSGMPTVFLSLICTNGICANVSDFYATVAINIKIMICQIFIKSICIESLVKNI